VTEPEAKVEAWHLEAAKLPIEWTGALHDDCTARWAGLSLRAEEMDRRAWRWTVYDERTTVVIIASWDNPKVARNGKQARAKAEAGARGWIARGAVDQTGQRGPD
jgi:hypothetical protein